MHEITLKCFNDIKLLMLHIVFPLIHVMNRNAKRIHS